MDSSWCLYIYRNSLAVGCFVMLPKLFSPKFDIFGITLHIYGFIIGVSIVLGWWIVEKIAKKNQVSQKLLSRLGLIAGAGAFVGARLWHVLTDFHLYQNSIEQVFSVWQGGLSILGAIFGGIVGLILAHKAGLASKKDVLTFVDLAAFGMPFAQAFGRLANWVNQELYGLPTDLPWKIYISPENRLPEFRNDEFFHPLFLYESLGSLLLGCFLLFFMKNKFRIGSGRVAATYLFGYALIRFFLDFLRPDKTMIAGWSLGINQFILLTVILFFVCLWLFGKKFAKN